LQEHEVKHKIQHVGRILLITEAILACVAIHANIDDPMQAILSDQSGHEEAIPGQRSMNVQLIALENFTVFVTKLISSQ